VSSADKTIKLWDVETGQEIRTLKGHDDSVYSVNFSSDGKTLVSGSADNTIKLWNVETGQEILTLNLSIALILVPTAIQTFYLPQ
jgi:WD40 repeat protein